MLKHSTRIYFYFWFYEVKENKCFRVRSFKCIFLWSSLIIVLWCKVCRYCTPLFNGTRTPAQVQNLVNKTYFALSRPVNFTKIFIGCLILCFQIYMCCEKIYIWSPRSWRFWWRNTVKISKPGLILSLHVLTRSGRLW